MQLRKRSVQLCNSSCGNLVCFLVPTNLGMFKRFAHFVNLVNTPTPKSCIKQSKMKLQMFRQFLPFFVFSMHQMVGNRLWVVCGCLSLAWPYSGLLFIIALIKLKPHDKKPKCASFSPHFLIVVICVGHVIWALFLGLFGFSFCRFPWVFSSVIWVKGREQVVCVFGRDHWRQAVF